LRAQEAEKEGMERGMERGMKRGIEQGKKTGKKIGEQIGREIGKKEGERKTKELITQRLLANGEDVQQIMEITDLTKEEVLKIQLNMKKYSETSISGGFSSFRPGKGCASVGLWRPYLTCIPPVVYPPLIYLSFSRNLEVGVLLLVITAG